MLYDFGKVDSAVQQAEASIEVAQAQVYLSTDDVAREAAQAWVELRRQQAMVAIAKSQLDGVGALAELARSVSSRARAPVRTLCRHSRAWMARVAN